MNNLRFWLLSLIAVLASGSIAAAQKPEKLGDFTAWQAFRMVEPSGQVVCWMLTDPQVSEPGNLRRGDPWLLVAHRPGQETRVISFESGFPMDASKRPIASVGGKNFAMFSKGGETAWSHPDDDASMITALKRGLSLTIESRSARGNDIRDQFSLRGFTKAYDKISQACNV